MSTTGLESNPRSFIMTSKISSPITILNGIAERCLDCFGSFSSSLNQGGDFSFTLVMHRNNNRRSLRGCGIDSNETLPATHIGDMNVNIQGHGLLRFHAAILRQFRHSAGAGRFDRRQFDGLGSGIRQRELCGRGFVIVFGLRATFVSDFDRLNDQFAETSRP